MITIRKFEAKDVARGFIYVVSSMGVTGVRTNIETDIDAIVASIREVTDVPAAVKISSKAQLL